MRSVLFVLAGNGLWNEQGDHLGSGAKKSTNNSLIGKKEQKSKGEVFLKNSPNYIFAFLVNCWETSNLLI